MFTRPGGTGRPFRHREGAPRFLRNHDMVENAVPGIVLNEDCDHYFVTRAGQELDAAKVASWVDQYADTQVKDLMLNPNGLTTYASEVSDPVWKGYDPEAGDDQPLLASRPPEQRKESRKFIHTAWQLHRDGIDPYELWIRRSRQVGISPWISMRMNDIHDMDDEQHFGHSEFWRNNPHLRRVTYRDMAWADRAYDYGKAEVREYNMKLVRELAERYDFDGFELDWMRMPVLFRPGYESEGAPLLTEFVVEVRRLLDEWGQKRGHRIKLGARVPSRPHTALALGMDAVTWARKGLVDMLVITPIFSTTDTDMPVEIWKQLLEGTDVTLAGGIEHLLRPHPKAPSHENAGNSLETVRGAAASLLDRGVDRIYLFNYMDQGSNPFAGDDPFDQEGERNYRRLLREVGSLDTIHGRPRRYVLTYNDLSPTGESEPSVLPAACTKGRLQMFRLHTGPKPDSGEVTLALGVEGETAIDEKSMEVRVNGELCDFAGPVDLAPPRPTCPICGYAVPLSAMKRGYNLVEIMPANQLTFGWVEFQIRP